MRLALAAAISMLPTSALRRLAYERVLGYDLAHTAIGFGPLIAVDTARIIDSSIGRFNRFVGPMDVDIGSGSRIGNHNVFSCGQWTVSTRQVSGHSYGRTLLIGANVLITDAHFFDVAGTLAIGDGTWIAGCASQFWTHGAGATDRDIRIGKACYVASAVRFAPGASVGDRVIVALGSVVVSKIEDACVMVAGVPAKVVRTSYDWRRDVHSSGTTDG